MRRRPLIPGILALLTMSCFCWADGPDTLTRYRFPTGEEAHKIKVQVEGMSEYPGGGYSLFLTKTDTPAEVYLPIVIGQCEANGISRAIAEKKFFRPLTYELFTDFTEKADIQLREIVITQLKEGTFYARLLCEQNNQTWTLDARPSDALNLALRLGAPIYTYQSVMDGWMRRDEK